MKKTQKPGYLVLGAVLIGVVAILMVYFIMIAAGLIQVSRQHITIVTQSASKLYDGEPLTADGWEVAGGKLLEGHKVEAVVTGSQTEVGVSDNHVTVYIYDSEGADVTDRYIIECQLGKLAVNGQLVEVVSGSAQKYYDGTPLTCPDWQMVNGSLAEGHECHVTVTGVATAVGTFPNTMTVRIIDTDTGEDVTNHYTLTVTEGTLTVAGIRLVISGDFNINDGVVDMSNILVSGELMAGHTLKIDPINQNLGGFDVNAVHAYVVDSNGNDVSEYYDIIYGADIPPIDIPLGEVTGGGGFGGGGFGGGNAMGEGPGSDAPIFPCLEILATKSGAIYLRGMSYGDFDGTNWQQASGLGEVSPFTFTVDSLTTNGVYKNDTLKVKMLLSTLPYMLPYYAREFAAEYIDDTMVNCGYTVNEPYTVQFSYYEYLSSHKYGVSSGWEALEREYAKAYESMYTSVDPETKKQLLELAAQAGISADSADVIAAVRDYIRNAATYDLDCGEAPEGVDKVIYFLTVSKSGVCRHFATAATLMYRSLGIPARYVEGFMAEAEENAWVEVGSDRAHAWVEVYISGMGWIAVEATPSSGNGGSGGGGGGGNGGNGGNGGGGAIRKHSVFLYTGSAVKDYDGTPLTNGYINWSAFGSLNDSWTKKSGTDMWVCSASGQEGHYFYESEAVVTGSQTYAGSSGNLVLLTVYDAEGNEVSADYRFYASGTLEVRPIVITITSESATMAYGVGALWNETCWVNVEDGKSLLEGHGVLVQFDITAANGFAYRGEEQNTFTARVLDANGNDVTSLYYKINKVYGTLTVK